MRPPLLCLLLQPSSPHSLNHLSTTTPSPGNNLCRRRQIAGFRLCDCLRRPQSYSQPLPSANSFPACERVPPSPRCRDQSTHPIELRKCDRLSCSATAPDLTISRSLRHKTTPTVLRLTPASQRLRTTRNNYSTSATRVRFYKPQTHLH